MRHTYISCTPHAHAAYTSYTPCIPCIPYTTHTQLIHAVSSLHTMHIIYCKHTKHVIDTTHMHNTHGIQYTKKHSFSWNKLMLWAVASIILLKLAPFLGFKDAYLTCYLYLVHGHNPPCKNFNTCSLLYIMFVLLMLFVIILFICCFLFLFKCNNVHLYMTW